MSEREKKSADETLKIIEEILDYNKRTQRTFLLASEVDKGKSEPKVDRRKLELNIKESIAKRVRLRRKKIDEIKEEKKICIINCLKNTLLFIKNQVICTKNYA